MAGIDTAGSGSRGSAATAIGATRVGVDRKVLLPKLDDDSLTGISSQSDGAPVSAGASVNRLQEFPEVLADSNISSPGESAVVAVEGAPVAQVAQPKAAPAIGLTGQLVSWLDVNAPASGGPNVRPSLR